MVKRYVLALAVILSMAAVGQAQEKERHRHHRRPLLRGLLKHPEAAANPYLNPYTDVQFWYPKYYGGFHYRQLHYYGDMSYYDSYGGRAW